MLKTRIPNKVFGPLNIIDNVLARGKGLKFEQEFKLTFHYDLKSYPGYQSKGSIYGYISQPY